ncbi:MULTISPECIES: ATP-grasp domain-containing protein [Mesorhizobium]|uniref:RimK family alpha-L-glutamate ligase n=1 Tax=Mesorhizobium denitrificans TaxID=2294114 RepID=A0A371XC54_9HYPH|nr:MULTISPECIES: RimK family alpha-L-glutamate ligase [Mesorhizobium]RFC66800.1 RimK family alpha-L-glutamate ligase [Mesorhizobium denitrificans]
MQHILICNDRTGPQSKALARALRAGGAKVTSIPLASLAFDTGAPHGIAIPGFNHLPDAIIVRSIAAGSFEAVTRRLGILHAMEALGVPVWNTAKAIERCVDKSMTSFLLANANIPTPRTFAVEGFDAAREIVERERVPLVIKPLFGAQGRGIKRIESVADLPPREAVADTYYLQHYIERHGPPFHDFRVFVCADRAIALMRRRSTDWISNVNRGASPETATDEDRTELERLAIAAAQAVGADFAGVDLVRDTSGRLFVLEVNSMPAWSGLQSVVKVDISAAIADALLASLGERRLRLVASYR